MEVKGFTPFRGTHCETTATGTLLGQLGIRLSEPLLFGLGQGLGFIYWKMKSMPCPFLGGRVKPDLLTRNIAANLGLQLTVKESASPRSAWEGVKALLEEGRLVGLKLDCYHLEYFARPIHFAGHYVALYGYDDTHAFLVDTQQQGGRVKTSLTSLEAARAEKGPMASKRLWYALEKGPREADLAKAVVSAAQANARDYLAAPIANLGWRGIAKAAREIPKWFAASRNRERESATLALLMEKAGTGGALFRNLYRDFLGEAGELAGRKEWRTARAAFEDIADKWTGTAALLEKAGVTGEERFVSEAAALLRDLSDREKAAMELLAQV